VNKDYQKLLIEKSIN